MACEVTLTAFEPGCNSVGGIKQLYIIDKDARETAGVTISVTNGAATIAGTGGTAYLWKPLQEGFSYTQAITQQNNDGTSSVLQSIDGVLHGVNAATSYLITELRKGRFEALVEQRDGTYMYFGLDFPGLQIGGGDAGASGQGINDPQGVTINLTCVSETNAPEVTFSEFEAAFTITSPA